METKNIVFIVVGAAIVLGLIAFGGYWFLGWFGSSKVSFFPDNGKELLKALVTDPSKYDLTTSDDVIPKLVVSYDAKIAPFAKLLAEKKDPKKLNNFIRTMEAIKGQTGFIPDLLTTEEGVVFSKFEDSSNTGFETEKKNVKDFVKELEAGKAAYCNVSTDNLNEEAFYGKMEVFKKDKIKAGKKGIKDLKKSINKNSVTLKNDAGVVTKKQLEAALNNLLTNLEPFEKTVSDNSK